MTMRLVNAWLLIGVVGVVGVVGCAKARQLVITADKTFGQAVFAIDEAEFTACNAKLINATTCTGLDDKVQHLLTDVQTVTRDLQLFPTAIPKSLGQLLSDLNAFEIITEPIPALHALTVDATAKATALIAQLGK